MFKFFLFALSFASIFLMSCSDDENNPTNKTPIVNSGNYVYFMLTKPDLVTNRIDITTKKVTTVAQGGMIFSPPAKGKIVYATPNQQVFFSDADGSNPVEIKFNKTGDNIPFLSPSGKDIIYNNNKVMYRYNLGSKTSTKIADQIGSEYLINFAPDGQTFSYATHNYSTNESSLFLIGIDGTNKIELENASKSNDFIKCSDWSPNGEYFQYKSWDKQIASTVIANKNGKSIHTIPANGQNLRCMSFSPDSKELLYFSVDNTSRTWKIIICGIDGKNPEEIFKEENQRINDDLLLWAPDGKSIFYSIGDFSNTEFIYRLYTYDLESKKTTELHSFPFERNDDIMNFGFWK